MMASWFSCDRQQVVRLIILDAVRDILTILSHYIPRALNGFAPCSLDTLFTGSGCKWNDKRALITALCDTALL